MRINFERLRQLGFIVFSDDYEVVIRPDVANEDIHRRANDLVSQLNLPEAIHIATVDQVLTVMSEWQILNAIKESSDE